MKSRTLKEIIVLVITPIIRYNVKIIKSLTDIDLNIICMTLEPLIYYTTDRTTVGRTEGRLPIIYYNILKEFTLRR
jgi:hypothetical protein